MQYGRVTHDGIVCVSYMYMWQWCRAYGRLVDNRNWRALFTHMGYRDKLPDHLLALAWVPINCRNLCIDSVCPSWIDKHGR